MTACEIKAQCDLYRGPGWSHIPAADFIPRFIIITGLIISEIRTIVRAFTTHPNPDLSRAARFIRTTLSCLHCELVLIALGSDKQGERRVTLTTKSSLDMAPFDSIGIYSFKGTFFFFSTSSLCRLFLLQIFSIPAPRITLLQSEYSCTLVLLFYFYTSPFWHSKQRRTPTNRHAYLKGDAAEKGSTCCCSGGNPQPRSRAYVNICHAFPISLLARTFFSISLILLLCDCQI